MISIAIARPSARSRSSCRRRGCEAEDGARGRDYTFDAERDDGKLTWCVPEDVPSGEYELRAHVPGAKPPIETMTRGWWWRRESEDEDAAPVGARVVDARAKPD